MVPSPFSILQNDSPNFRPSLERVSKSVEEKASHDSSYSKVSTLERLIRTHPVWFLPDLTREDATHLLQGKEDGVRCKLRVILLPTKGPLWGVRSPPLL